MSGIGLCLGAGELLAALFLPGSSPSIPPQSHHLPPSVSPPVNPVFDKVSLEFPANNALALVIARHTCISTKLRELVHAPLGVFPLNVRRFAA